MQSSCSTTCSCFTAPTINFGCEMIFQELLSIIRFQVLVWITQGGEVILQLYNLDFSVQNQFTAGPLSGSFTFRITANLTARASSSSLLHVDMVGSLRARYACVSHSPFSGACRRDKTRDLLGVLFWGSYAWGAHALEHIAEDSMTYASLLLMPNSRCVSLSLLTLPCCRDEAHLKTHIRELGAGVGICGEPA